MCLVSFNTSYMEACKQIQYADLLFRQEIGRL